MSFSRNLFWDADPALLDLEKAMSCAVCLAAAVCLPARADASAWADELDASFALRSEDARIEPRDLGLVNGHVTFNGWVEDLGSVRQLYAPPYHCGSFRLDVTFGGAAVKPVRWTWRPECVVREGTAGVWRVTTRLYPLANARGGILAIEAENGGGTPAALNVDCRVGGTPGYRRKWVFDAPSGADGSFPDWRGEVRGYVLDSEGRPARVTFGTSSGSGTWEHSAKMSLSAAAGGTAPTAYAVFSLAGPDEADATVRQALADPAGAVRAARAAWRGRVAELAARVPRFSSDNEALVRLYRRSLIHFPLTRWEVDEFVLKPFYVTGGLFGSCMCSYLWNLGGPYRMWAMVDPAVIREQLKAYLRLDLTRCYALNPCDGGPVGPYYPVNQEKMIFMIRAYVLGTGDVGFLRETVGGKSIVEHVVGMALFHDDLTKEAVLADYGKANDHLELRRGFPYNGEMPDLNLRRIVLLRLADKLCRLAGHDPKVDLVRRADALKALCRREQWDAEQRWFVGRCANGKRTTRWTIQMFKALGWGDWVLDADARDGLIGHLMDESEFLGSHGVHSLSKKDEAWDDWDVDNGGPGACVSFAPAIAERLYADGRAREAETILRRLTWLADGYPYWCDSHYADRADYRHNTPLQLNVEGGVIAQAIIFGLFGIAVDDDFSVRATPHLPADTDMIALEGVKLAGRTFSVRCSRKEGTKVLGLEPKR